MHSKSLTLISINSCAAGNYTLNCNATKHIEKSTTKFYLFRLIQAYPRHFLIKETMFVLTREVSGEGTKQCFIVTMKIV